MKKQIKTEVVIQASAEKVWDILMDFEKYPSWNPFIKFIQKDIKNSNKLKVTIKPPQSKEMSFNPKITSNETYKRFSWLGKLFISGIFDGEHVFELIANSDGTTTFVQTENFKGLLVSMIDLSKTEIGFKLMNESLKQLAEMKSIKN